MKSSYSQWKALLLRIATTINKPLLLRWGIRTGADFQMLLPEASQFGEESFKPEVEFTYDYDDIVRISSVDDIPGFEVTTETVSSLQRLADEFEFFEFLPGNNGGFSVELK